MTYRIYHRYTQQAGDKPTVEKIRELSSFDETVAEAKKLKDLGYHDIFAHAMILDPRGWNMHSWLVRKALGLPKKLPPSPAQHEIVGVLQGFNIWDMGQRPGRRKHRLYAQVGPNQYVPVGRLHQYILDLEDR